MFNVAILLLYVENLESFMLCRGGYILSALQIKHMKILLCQIWFL
jgi:hypothetical protein